MTETSTRADSSVFGAIVDIAKTGYLVNSGTDLARGTTEIVIDTGTGSLSKGQKIQFASDSTIYTIESIDAAMCLDTNDKGVGIHGTTVTQITISPGLQLSTGNNATITPVVTAAFTDATCDTDHTATVSATTGITDTFGANTKLIQMDSTQKIAVGMHVAGTGIATDSIVTAISKAKGSVTVTDGDAANGMTAGTKITMMSTDGHIVDYILSDTNDGGVAHLGVVVAGATMKSTGSVTASLTTGAVGIAVGINLSSATQNAFLVALKEAIEHANGHAGRIIVGGVPAEANGNQVITLDQRDLTPTGNHTITETMANVAVSGFSSTLFTVSLATTASNNNQTLTFTPVTGQPLPPYQVTDSIVILADAGNAADVYVGSSTVTNGKFGFALAAGSAIEVKCTDASSVYIAGTTADHVYITGS